MAPAEAPPPGTVERWAWDYLQSESLEVKLSPPPPPTAWEEDPPPRRIDRPGRPASLSLSAYGLKTPGPEALRSPARRAQLAHTFLHHELQAAELFCWALLAFPETPRAFRRGLIGICLDEVRHIGLYRGYLEGLNHQFGDFPVRDWFWERVPTSATAAHFVAALGVGFEGANLDHTARFAERFRAIGDEEGARIQELVGAEEIPHVRFALRWLREWTGTDDFMAWVRHLPPPLSPILMKGKPINLESRAKAGLSEEFLRELERWSERAPGS